MRRVSIEEIEEKPGSKKSSKEVVENMLMVVNNAPTPEGRGQTTGEMRKRLKVVDKLEAVQDDQSIGYVDFEDGEYDTLKACYAAAATPQINRFLVAVEDRILASKAPEKPN